MQASITNTEIRNAVISTLKYFNIFQFPLYFSEIQKYFPVVISNEELELALREMVVHKDIFLYDGLYMLQDSPPLTMRRINGAIAASNKMAKAHKAGRNISRFPFVKAVCISGSLSKGYADDKSDIDFFIITKNHRLWICRSLLHIFKKLTFLVNEQHSYCMNYFLDEQHLCLEETNIFTATELATLIPVYNQENLYEQFIGSNTEWLSKQYPNIEWRFHNNELETKEGILKRLSESLLNLFMPKQLNKTLMQLTDKMWRMKWQRKNYPMHEYDLAMKTKWYVSKNHPANYQKKVLTNLVVKPA